VTASRRVVIGADTHLDTIHLAVITAAGKPLADAEISYLSRRLWRRGHLGPSFGTIAIAGVGGRHLQLRGGPDPSIAGRADRGGRAACRI
jgi:hypothetical protein